MNKHLLALHQLPKMTNARLFKIWQGSHDWESIWKNATACDFKSWGIEDDVAQEFLRAKENIDIDALGKKLEEIEATFISWDDKNYPVLLKELPDPPFLLYVRGDASILSLPCLAVVGTRLMTTYGKQVLDDLLQPLVQSGLVIVSGLAIGIDAYAHKTTLDHHGKTIAVLGSGVDKIYPANNRKLAEDIVEKGGALISEFPLGMEPTVYTFPIRNRIISGLSKGTLVVEAKESSGSLITAKLALEQNRDVFAVPGNMFSSNMAGTHNLIKKGEAKLVTHATDILEELGLVLEPSAQLQKLEFENLNEEKVYLLLSKEPVQADQLIQESELPSSEVSSLLTVLEVKGLVQNLGGGMWVRK